jgi:hypothetical protein
MGIAGSPGYCGKSDGVQRRLEFRLWNAVQLKSPVKQQQKRCPKRQLVVGEYLRKCLALKVNLSITRKNVIVTLSTVRDEWRAAEHP